MRDDDKFRRLCEIARHVRRSGTVSSSAAMLFQDIAEMTEQTDQCNARNDYFAEQYDTHERTIRRWISELTEHGWVKRKASNNALSLTEKAYRTVSPSPRAKIAETPNAAPEGRTELSAPPGQKCPVPSINNTSGEESESRAKPSGSETPPSSPSREASQEELNPARPDFAPSLQQVLGNAKNRGITSDIAEAFFWHHESKAEPWTDRGGKRMFWPAALQKWAANERQFEMRATGTESSTPRRGDPGWDEYERNQFRIIP